MSGFTHTADEPRSRVPLRADELHLDRVVSEIAEADKVARPKFYIMEGGIYDRVPMAQELELEPNAFGVNRRMMETLGCTEHNVSPEMRAVLSHHMQRSVPGEMRGLLAHEMHHLQHTKLQAGVKFLPLFLFPAAAMAGYHFWRRAHEGAKDNAQFHTNLDGIIAQQQGLLLPHPNPSTENHFLTAAKYAAVGMAGVAASLVSARYFSRAFEYAADLHGVKHSSPEAMANALKKVHDAIEHGTGPNVVKPSLYRHFREQTFSAHPSLEQRLANLQNVR